VIRRHSAGSASSAPSQASTGTPANGAKPSN
jgi:hypothetical protein